MTFLSRASAFITRKRHAFGLGVFTASLVLFLHLKRSQYKLKRELSLRCRLFCAEVPKLELHAHLHGSVRMSTLLELCSLKNIPFDPSLLSNESRDLSQCFKIFDLIHNVVTEANTLRRVVREVLSDFAHNNVCYLELRTTPRPLQDDGTTIEEYVNIVLEEMVCYEQTTAKKKSKAEVDHPGVPPKRLSLIPRLILSMDRSKSPEEAMKIARLAADLYSSGRLNLVGVDLGGNPTKNDFKMFQPALQFARDAGLRVSVHCGETPCDVNYNGSGSGSAIYNGSGSGNRNGIDNVLPPVTEKMTKASKECEDVLNFRPDRLGHALYLPTAVLNKLAEDPIPIECCPTSNVMTMEFGEGVSEEKEERLKLHPNLPHWLETGYPISISTDDSGVFSTNPTKELLLMRTAFDINEWQISGLVWGSIDHVFEPSRRVRSLLARDVSIYIKRLTRKLVIPTKKKKKRV